MSIQLSATWNIAEYQCRPATLTPISVPLLREQARDAMERGDTAAAIDLSAQAIALRCFDLNLLPPWEWEREIYMECTPHSAGIEGR